MWRATFNIPTVYNYMDAAVLERDIKPIRGKPDCKPMGKRRNTWATIRKEQDESYACRLHHTDVVVFHKDGRIVVNMSGWNSQTSIRFLEEVLGAYIFLRHNRVWVNCAVAGVNGVGEHALITDGPNTFRRNAQGDLEYENNAKIMVHKVNRKEANIVRARLKPFREYLDRTMRLRGDGWFSGQEFADVFGLLAYDVVNFPVVLKVHRSRVIHRTDTEALMSLCISDKPEDNYKALLWLVRSEARYYNHSKVSEFQFRTTVDDLLASLEDLMKFAFRDEFFIETEAMQGKAILDPYAKFFD